MNPDPEPAFHFNEDPDPFPNKIDENLRSLNECTYAVQALQSSILSFHASMGSVDSPSRMYSEPRGSEAPEF